MLYRQRKIGFIGGEGGGGEGGGETKLTVGGLGVKDSLRNGISCVLRKS